MNQTQQSQEPYEIPLIMRSSYKIKMHILFVFLILLFFSVSFIPAENLPGMFVKLFFFSAGLFFLYGWVYMGILKKGSLELTEEGMILRTIFNIKRIKWMDVAEVKKYYLQGNLYIGVITNQKLILHKDNFLTSLSIAFGGGYSLSVPLASFSKIEPKKLYVTIATEAQEKSRKNENGEGADREVQQEVKEIKVEKPLPGNPKKAISLAFLTALLAGIIYGLCIYLLNINFLIIPILGMMGIMYVFFKHCQTSDFNFIIRLGLGLACAMQFFIALLVILIILNLDFLNGNGVLRTILECTIYIIRNSSEFFSYYIYAAICFFYGAFQGYSSKTTRRLHNLFMRRQNGFTIKKEKGLRSIFLIDYAKYRENEDKSILTIVPNTCLIEKEKNYILAFYIPEKVALDHKVNMTRLERAFVKGEMYYKLDLGGRAEPQPYGYSCNLLLNKYRKVELVQLETE